MKSIKKIIMVVLSCFLVAINCTVPVHAMDNGGASVQYIGGATFIGEYAENLELSVDNDYFFRADIMNPGDVWESHITVRNPGKKDVEVSLLEILNKLNDSKLLDVLNLRITLSDGTVIYDGKYSKTPTPVIDWIPLRAGETLELLIYKEFPAECGNDFQGAKFETEWVFQIRAEEKTGPTDKDDESESKDPEKENPQDESSDRRDDSENTNKDSDTFTGDKTKPLVWVCIGGIATAGFAAGIAYSKKKKKSEVDGNEK